MFFRPSNSATWSRLDNAAKIFPANSTLRDPKVFRFCCELTEQVNPELLQQALEQTLKDFPHYRCVLRRGLFWYFLEDSDLVPLVEEERLPLCSPLYDRDRRGLLFRVLWYRCRINVEVYHALSDGTGALQFQRALLYHYLLLRHGDTLGELPPLDYDASLSQKLDDSFARYYRGGEGEGGEQSATKNAQHAFKLTGARLSEYRLRILEGSMPVDPLLQLARDRGTTLTVLLGALLLQSIGETMPPRLRKHPVVLSIPVNLRTYFESQSARNFFGIFYAGHSFGQGEDSLEEIMASLDRCFRNELRPERLAARMNKLAALEHNIFTRAIPLFLKDITLKVFGYRSQQQMTAAFSNIGRISMPEPLLPYISSFVISASTDKLQVCLSTFKGRLTISVTEPFTSTEIPMQFFRKLTALGAEVTINTNLCEGGER